MDYEIRLIKENEFNQALTLIEKTFNKFVAPYYTAEGIECFNNNYFNNSEMLRKFNSENGAFLEFLMVVD